MLPTDDLVELAVSNSKPTKFKMDFKSGKCFVLNLTIGKFGVLQPIYFFLGCAWDVRLVGVWLY